MASIEFPADGLMELTGARNTHDGIWMRCKTRKPFECRMSGRRHKTGEIAYRPLGNGQYRMHRIASTFVEREKGELDD